MKTPGCTVHHMACWMQQHIHCLMIAMWHYERSLVLTQPGCMQLSTKLKVGVMWDHNGTYMEGFGFQYRNHQIAVEITQDDKIAGESLAPSASALLSNLPQSGNLVLEAA